MKVGDRVRVTSSVIIYIHPEHRNQPFDLEGSEGEIVDILTDWNGRPISPNLPVVVKFASKLKVHLKESEIEMAESES
ncbi:MAG: ferredoxin--nitrite reductase [Oscillatoriales cyanobacterium RM1_1_9]|nr:ferredoxin--nitrite reductase [Oscillatoriales cyanobacterium SM2_3_0]NJO46518.1 ferredoxin--nitrite reductase [Oscillatoriales cyanobacterium RM2_1_1]NJO70657.1 ferredoxin--nitrite reductase [Oscillatoriales cyanobacterium RM1_1_9]